MYKRFPRRDVAGILISVACCLLALLPLPVSAAVTYTSFDVPPAGPEGFQVRSVNNRGDVAGFYWDGLGEQHGFMRRADGVFTSIDISGMHVYGWGVNDSGSVVGTFESGAGPTSYAFLRGAGGGFTRISPPWAYQPYGSSATAINDAGTIAGTYVDHNGQYHGYLRDSAGNYTSFDPPDSAEVGAVFLNESGQIAGWYSVQPGGAQNDRGFLRDVDGTITTFDVPGYGPPETLALGPDGSIAGVAQDSSGIYHDFLRGAFGNIVVFDVPNGKVNRDAPVGISNSGNLVGNFMHSAGLYGGWQRTPDGSFTYFSDPDAGIHGPGTLQGTIPECASANGKVAGVYYDSESKIHGFVAH